MKKHDDIEDLFKESFENFEADVRPQTWDNVQTALKGAGIGVFIKAMINKIGTNTLIGIASSAATVIGTVMIMNWTGNTTKKEVSPIVETNKTAETPIEETPANKVVTALSDSNDNSMVDVAKTKPVSQVKSKTQDKEKFDNLIKELKEEKIALITPSVVSGTVPLIVDFSNKGNGRINNWDFGDGKKEKNKLNPFHVYDIPGIYTVILTSTTADGKTTADSIKIEVYGNSNLSDIPESFTPNGDGDRDYFPFNGENLKYMKATVFDFSGKIVFESNVVGGKWDGKDKNGINVQEGKYYYIVNAEGIGGKKYERKGTIKLAR